MTPKIVVVGSANTDFVLSTTELPSKGETVLGDQFRVVRGGKGANSHLTAQDVSAASSAIRAADCLLLQLEIRLRTVQAAEISHRHNVSVFLNPAPAQKLRPEILKLDQFMVSSASGPNPADQAAVDLPNQAETPS